MTPAEEAAAAGETPAAGLSHGPPILSRVPREDAHPPLAADYTRFWKDSTWMLFLAPGPGVVFETARETAEARTTSALPKKPGVYEFALTASRSGGGRRIKVYVGETKSLHQRLHCEYRGDGSHNREHFAAALASGLTVWRRHREVGSKEAAQVWEGRFLAQYDYAWNTRGNGMRREVGVGTYCCGLWREVVVDTPEEAARKRGGRAARYAFEEGRGVGVPGCEWSKRREGISRRAK